MMADHRRVLYVEDQEDMRFLMKIILDHNGFDAVTASTGRQALELARTEAFDLFMLDSRLPDMSGEELCRQIRTQNRHTPVLFFSGLADKSDRQAAFSAGAQGYVVKPADPEVIIKAVNSALASAEHQTRSADVATH
jgi:two-component system, OmpR family, response regulator ResD